MFKNIFNSPDSLRNAILGQDELRAKSQQGLQAVKSGVESLRTVLANNPLDSNSRHGQQRQQQHETLRPSSAGSANQQQRSSLERDSSGSWSFLPPSLSGNMGRHLQRSSISSSGSGSGSIKDVTESITDSVTESIKSISSGLKLGQLAEGLGFNHGSTGQGPLPGSGVFTRRGTIPGEGGGRDSIDHASYHKNQGPYISHAGGDGKQLRKSRGWTWNGNEHGQDGYENPREADMVIGDDIGSAEYMKIRGIDSHRSSEGSSHYHPRNVLKTGTKTEVAAKETAALVGKIRQQQDEDLAVERAKRMPEVAKMARRYQDSWIEIHSHSARNSEKADAAEEILKKVIEFCMQHVRASDQLAKEVRDLKVLDKNLEEMLTVS
ncbi:hypothetical protein BX616_004224, partial [Lobosporangium transversale]